MVAVRREEVMELEGAPEFPTADRLYGSILPLEDIQHQVSDERDLVEIQITEHNTIAARGIERVLRRPHRIFLINAYRFLQGEEFSAADLLDLGFQTEHTGQKARSQVMSVHGVFRKELGALAGRDVIERRSGGSEGAHFWWNPTVAVVDYRPGITAETYRKKRRVQPLSRREILQRAVGLFGEDEMVQRAVLNLTLDSDEGDRRAKSDSMGAYLHEMGRFRLLDNETETPNLFGHIDRGVAAALEIEDWDKLSPTQESLLWNVAAAREIIYHANLRLVVRRAVKFQGHGLTQMELVQEGNVGLMSAIANFDVSKRFAFSTYATNWIDAYIKEALAEQTRTIRLPQHVHLQHLALSRQVEDVERRLGVELSEEERLAVSGMPREKYSLLTRAGRKALLSLDAPFNEGEDGSLMSFLAEQPASSSETENITAQREVASLLDQAALDDRERFVLGLMCGLNPAAVGFAEEDTTMAEAYRTAWEECKNAGYNTDDLGVWLGIKGTVVANIKAQVTSKLRVAADAMALQNDPE